MNKHKHKLITTAILFTLASGIIHIINKLIFASATMKEMLRGPSRKYYDWRFGRIYYTKQGKGTPLLLIHDLTVYSSDYEWNIIIDELTKKYTVYTLDLLGCGRSDKQNITYTNYIYVQLLSDFIKNVIGERTDIIASGFSSSFTIMACHNEDEYFGKLMLINPPSLNELNQAPNKKTKIFKFLLELPIFGTLVYNMITARENVELLFTEKYFYNPFLTNSRLVDIYYECAHKGESTSKYLHSSIIGRYTNNNINHALEAIDQSIFIISGAEEKNGEEIMESYVQLNPAIETAIIPKAKHLPQLEAPGKLLEQIAIFFA
jgi:pimeloyl-ACP methyl ester carboxylesterase